jgi:hypothetical protein
MFLTKTARLLLIAFALVIGALAIGNIEVELPPELQGMHQIEQNNRGQTTIFI